MRFRTLILGALAAGAIGAGAVGVANADRLMRGLDTGRSLPELLVYAADVVRTRYPSVGEPIAPIVDMLRPSPDAVSAFPRDAVDLETWRGTGASPDLHLPSPFYDAAGRPQPTPVPVAVSGLTRASVLDTVEVVDETGLRRALKEAVPGREIVIAPGTYRLGGTIDLVLRADGRPDAPIVVRAERLGAVTLEFAMREGFHVKGAHWVFENLDIRGTCTQATYCDHAFHVVGDARGTIIRNTRMVDFNAPLKVNGIGDAFPDAGLVEFSTFAATERRRTDAPVSFIDIVGASDWTVRHSLIADAAKAGGDGVSYAGFMKGGGSGGVFDANLVICSMVVPVARETRVGLSFGGGGTSPANCRGPDCGTAPEHTGGRLSNNIIMHCPDVGIYLNRAAVTDVSHNTLYNTLGVDVRYPDSTAYLRNNVIAGRIHERDGGMANEGDNIVMGSFFSADRRPREMREWFADADAADFRLRAVPPLLAAGAPLETVDTDFCGHRRGAGGADLGAIEYRAGGCSPAGFLASLTAPAEEARRP